MKTRMIFTTIGYIEWRKGQDLLIDAIEEISVERQDQCLFWIVGQDCSLMAQRIRERIADKPWIRMTGTVSREEIHEILKNTDVLICPSREDPMPTVCAEAMMHCLPCLVSDAIGTAAYISDGANGMIFKSEDVSALHEKILWCMENRETVKRMGTEAYKVFVSVFSVTTFEKNLMEHVNSMIKLAGDSREWWKSGIY